MKSQHRYYYRPSSMLILSLLVIIGMVVTTLVQAEQGPSYNAWLRGTDGFGVGSLRASGSPQVPRAPSFSRGSRGKSSTPWLLADHVRGSYADGVFHMHISGLRSGSDDAAASRAFGKMDLVLSAGTLEPEMEHSSVQDDAGGEDDLLMHLVGDYRLFQGDVFAISFGKRW